MGKGLKGTLWYLLGCPVGTTQLTWNYASHPTFLGKDCQGREEEIKTKKVKGKEEVGKNKMLWDFQERKVEGKMRCLPQALAGPPDIQPLI